MSSTTTTSSDETLNTTTPLLSPPTSPTRRSPRRPSLRDAARFFRRASSGRRMMREPSMLVREAAAEQLEERQSNWGYSKPVVLLDTIWNLAFVICAGCVLLLSIDEKPTMPLRVWVVGYALQCLVHMVCVLVEYRRRRRRRRRRVEGGEGTEEGGLRSSGDLGQYVSLPQLEEESSSVSVAKHLESANTMFSFIWWIVGFYWISMGGQALAQTSPQLYWVSIIFLGFDVFFVVFCVALACIIGLAVCCCLPCIIAILYAVSEQEGASKEDIDKLPKYKFRKTSDNEKLSGDVQGTHGGVMTECGTDSPTERIISEEDVECCICLSAYEDGVELRELPCGHHFHCDCVDKWLHINATCPLCKYNILKGCSSTEEV